MLSRNASADDVECLHTSDMIEGMIPLFVDRTLSSGVRSTDVDDPEDAGGQQEDSRRL